MFQQEPSPTARPWQVVGAARLQTAVAGLLVVAAVTYAASAYLYQQVFAGSAMGYGAALLLLPAVWPAVTTPGLRRGSRNARRWSLAGLVVPPATLVAGGTTYPSELAFFTGPGADPVRVAARLDASFILSTGAIGVAAVALILGLVTAALLLSHPVRRFVRSVPSAATRS
ncbi:hypothetical protein [Actinoplanes sp. NPDC020271]|uniref:hypothetical protein n=1 Tax=Actinoplanes sp. NPDC020271 TaxID=3363896 RepID=UPI0037A2E95E